MLSAILSTFIKLPFVIKICLFLFGRCTQVLFYMVWPWKMSTHVLTENFDHNTDADEYEIKYLTG